MTAIADTPQGKISSWEMLQVTQKTMSELINDGKFVIGLGGEQYYYGHSPRRPEDPDAPLTVIKIDDRGDLRYEYEGSLHNWRHGPDKLAFRSICKEEADLMKSQKLPAIGGREIVTQPDWPPW